MVEAKIKALRDELERHNYNYYVLSAPTISDFEFDKMMKELQELEAAHPEFADPDSPTRRVGSDLSKEFEQVVHKYPMLSLGNTYSEDEIRDFLTLYVREFLRICDSRHEAYCATENYWPDELVCSAVIFHSLTTF